MLQHLSGRHLFLPLMTMMLLVGKASMAQDNSTQETSTLDEGQRELEAFFAAQENQHQQFRFQEIDGRNGTRNESASTQQMAAVSTFVIVAVVVVCVLIVFLVVYFVAFAAEQDANTRTWRKRQPYKAKEYKEAAESEIHPDGPSDEQLRDRDRDREQRPPPPPPPPKPSPPKKDSSERMRQEDADEEDENEDAAESRQALGKKSSAKPKRSSAMKKLRSTKLKHGKSSGVKAAKSSKTPAAKKIKMKLASATAGGKKKSSKRVQSKKPATKSKSRKKK